MKIKLFALSALASVALIGAAQAQMIGIQFVGSSTLPLSPSDVAGFQPQANWNVATNASGTSTSLTDNSGSPVLGLTAVWQSDFANNIGVTFVGPDNTPGNVALYSGGLYSFGSDNTSLSLTNIPFSTYNVYAYFEGNGGGPAAININATTITAGATVGFTPVISDSGYTGGTTFLAYNNFNPQTGFVAASGVGQAPANYALFSGVSGSNLTVNLHTFGATNLLGVQIVSAVPEPSSGAMTLLSGLGILIDLRRFRKQNT